MTSPPSLFPRQTKVVIPSWCVPSLHDLYRTLARKALAGRPGMTEVEIQRTVRVEMDRELSPPDGS